MKYHSRNITILPEHSGFTVLETLFALVLFSLALVTLMTIAGRGLSTANSSYETLVANYLNQESVEAVRYVRDTNFITTPTPVSWLSGLDICTISTPCELLFTKPSPVPQIVNCPSRRCSQLYEGNGTYDTIMSPTTSRETSFVRTIVVRPIINPNLASPEEALVTSRVSWNSRGIPRSVSYTTLLHKWR